MTAHFQKMLQIYTVYFDSTTFFIKNNAFYCQIAITDNDSQN